MHIGKSHFFRFCVDGDKLMSNSLILSLLAHSPQILCQLKIFIYILDYEKQRISEKNESSHFKGVLNGFLIQVRDIKTAPNSLRKDTKCISALIIKKNFEIFLKIFEFFQIFFKYFFEKKYINLNFNENF